MTRRSAGTGTFEDVAGFRNGRGQNRGAGPQQQSQYPPQQPPHYGYGPAADGEPEYFGAPDPGPGAAPSYDDRPGSTRSFAVNEAQGPYAQGSGNAPGSWNGDEDHIATYRAGQATAPPSGPRLHWQDLLRGIALRPAATFWQMRDYQVWAPALTVTFLYGLLAVFGFDTARADVLNATLSNSVPWVISTAIAVIISGLMLGAVTNALARQLGGDGAWAPTISLAMLITSLTDAPRLVFAIFLGGGNSFVQVLGWITWIACAGLLTSMVSKSHDLPWPKALGAASIQLIALLVLFKLPVI
ncbi:YIP1 family protein [Actinacidiphila oryziradicis]|uniref:YIP1 family protein n=2 Tax=Actinacidiphila oryziradicis TaxID=2571141 RepID=A0A4U0SMS5_9ACTN|nr:Yip1 family protein [Actinacidiphila oryziradicis]TKA11254.1 YIP1 family protein [Actinacidiphila oryziradicis]